MWIGPARVSTWKPLAQRRHTSHPSLSLGFFVFLALFTFAFPFSSAWETHRFLLSDFPWLLLGFAALLVQVGYSWHITSPGTIRMGWCSLQSAAHTPWFHGAISTFGLILMREHARSTKQACHNITKYPALGRRARDRLKPRTSLHTDKHLQIIIDHGVSLGALDAV